MQCSPSRSTGQPHQRHVERAVADAGFLRRPPRSAPARARRAVARATSRAHLSGVAPVTKPTRNGVGHLGTARADPSTAIADAWSASRGVLPWPTSRALRLKAGARLAARSLPRRRRRTPARREAPVPRLTAGILHGLAGIARTAGRVGSRGPLERHLRHESEPRAARGSTEPRTVFVKSSAVDTGTRLFGGAGPPRGGGASASPRPATTALHLRRRAAGRRSFDRFVTGR